MPRYLNEWMRTGIRGTAHVWEWSSMGINTDLSQLILRPEYSPKVSMTFAAASKESEESSRKQQQGHRITLPGPPARLSTHQVNRSWHNQKTYKHF